MPTCGLHTLGFEPRLFHRWDSNTLGAETIAWPTFTQIQTEDARVLTDGQGQDNTSRWEVQRVLQPKVAHADLKTLGMPSGGHGRLLLTLYYSEEE